jgi:hypothetical protein
MFSPGSILIFEIMTTYNYLHLGNSAYYRVGILSGIFLKCNIYFLPFLGQLFSKRILSSFWEKAKLHTNR